MIHHSDNLTLLRSFPENHIDLIYSDILYGTGKNREYQDLKPIQDEIVKFYKPRLIEMRRVLKTTGSIFLQMDTRINHWMRILMDEVFGYNQFRNSIIWQYNSAPRGKKDFGKRHDIILRYSKTNDYYFNTDNIRVPYAKSAPRGYEKEKYYNDKGKVMGDVWVIPMIAQNDKTERVGYYSQKPLKLMYPILHSSCPTNGLVADFFMGSGTFLVAAKELGYNYIGCDNNINAIEKTKERLK